MENENSRLILRQRDDSMARVVVNNVQVLAAGTRFDQENAKDGKPVPSTVITLLVTVAYILMPLKPFKKAR